MDVEGVVGDTARMRSVAWYFMMDETTAGFSPWSMALQGHAPGGVHGVGLAGDPGQQLLNALEIRDRGVELLADSRIGAGREGPPPSCRPSTWPAA